MAESSSGEPLEIERKFLIRMPDRETLERESVKRIRISQIYLRADAGVSARLRRSETDSGTTLFLTEKTHVTHRTRVEREREISPREWAELIRRADPDRRPIEKTRWCVPYAGHMLEIDVFPFWDARAFCEAERAAEDEDLSLPEWICVIREVTEDPRYNNSSLALAVPMEDIP